MNTPLQKFKKFIIKTDARFLWRMMMRQFYFQQKAEINYSLVGAENRLLIISFFCGQIGSWTACLNRLERIESV